MLRYGAAAQVGSVGQLLFEPSTKALLALFGGLSLTAYFETANRAVAQCRSLIVAAYQTLIPYIAHRAGHSDLTPAQISTTYRSVHAILILISFPYFGILATSLPLVFGLWLGRDESQFVAIGLACALGWGINTLMVSSYTIYLAIGQLRWTLWTQLAIGTLNVLLATLGGWAFGGNGVVPGSMLALAVGSSVVTAAFHRQFGLHCREFFPKASATIVGASVIGPCMLLAMQLWPGSHMTDRWLIFAGLLSQTLVCAVLVWRHPVIAALIARLRTPNIDGARAGLA
jgi:O-antigen/teichoic acid export membrane protein